MTGHLRPAIGVQLHILGSEGILFDELEQRLYYMNCTATCIWCHLEQYPDVATIAAETAHSLSIEIAVATAYAYRMVEHWTRLGLLQGRSRTARNSPSRRDPLEIAADPTAEYPLLPLQRRYRLLGTTFVIGVADIRLDTLIYPGLRHLEVGASGPADVELTVISKDNRYELRWGQKLLAACDFPQAVAPLVDAHLVRLAAQRQSHFMALHAAALSSSAGCLLLPASAGSGKTTLAAALLRAGWNYMSDDLVLLRHDSLGAVPVPESLCIKEGSWDVLGSRYPELAHLAVHQRDDARRVRYLAPPTIAQGDDEEQIPVRWIVFPRYAADGTSDLRALGSARGLCQLLAQCCGFPGFLKHRQVRRLIRWIADIPCFEMDFSDLDEAITRLGALTRDQTAVLGGLDIRKPPEADAPRFANQSRGA